MERGSMNRVESSPVDTDALIHTEVLEGRSPVSLADPVFDISDLSVYYGEFRAVRDVTLPIPTNHITALIGPSGCGKTTVLRCFNRMNDLIETARVKGKILYHGV